MIKFINISEEGLTAKAAHSNSVSNKPYYDFELDSKKREVYYCANDFEPDELHSLLVKTHTKQLNYSPHQYVYPWVDLHENLQLKSLYSGQKLDPLKMIDEDLKLLITYQEGGIYSKDRMIFNTEHVVPQSWFDGNEPMRGDLHHLFACEPGCNSMRSNFPYNDFPSYSPEFETEGIRTGCGMAEDGRFEPEYGKGIVARAVFYFSLRYKGVIRLKDKLDFGLLLKWHEVHPVTLYEKHRNAAIQELQGNRNPFIDFPDLADKMIDM
jgi:deoxyribonuclease I